MNDPVYLVDGYSLIYRAYFAFIRNPLYSPDGRNTSAVFGFFRILFNLIKNTKPKKLAIIMDSRTPTFRHKMYPEYKANREKAPEDLHAQVPIIEDLLNALGIIYIKKDGYEADDIIATIAENCTKNKTPCFILSGDKDLLQLVNSTTSILLPEKGASDYSVLKEDDVLERRNVRPDQILDYLALTGDKSDNIPGVMGIGDKTATSLLREFGSLDGVYGNIDKIKSKSQQEKLRTDKENAYLSYKLATLVKDLDLGLESNSLLIKNEDTDRALSIFNDLGIRTFNNELGGFTETPEKELDKIDTGMYDCILKEEELDKWISRVKENIVFSFDVETDSTDDMEAVPLGFSICTQAKEACYIPVKAEGVKCIDEDIVKSKLKTILTDLRLKLVGQNIKFDYKVVKNWGIEISNIYFDTMIAAWVINSSQNQYNMDKLAEDYLGYSTIKYTDVIEKKDMRNLSQIDIKTVTDYAAEDADITFRLYEVLIDKLKSLKLSDLFFTIEVPNIKLLAEMELSGIKLNTEELRSFSIELNKRLSEIADQIYSIHGKEFNIDSTKQLQEVLFKERGLPPVKKTKTGYSTDVKVLEALAYDPICANVLEHRKLSKLKSTYVDALPGIINKKTGRIHTQFIQTGTTTGRLSSKNPNLQNIPIKDELGRRIRSAFISESGYTFLSADYSQIELVLMANLSHDEALKYAFLNDRDIHTQTASLLFNIDQSDVDADQRRIGKTINYSVIYGMTGYTLAQVLKIPRKTANGFIETYFDRYSGVKEFMRSIIEAAEKTGYVETIMGRKRFIPEISSRNRTEKNRAERAAFNTRLQGSAADIVKIAMLKIDREIKSKNLKSKLLLQVHDELILEVPDTEINIISPLIKDCMENAVKLDIPLKANIELTKNWGDIH
jgi:DNA polymerase I